MDIIFHLLLSKRDLIKIVFFQDTSETTFANPSCSVGGGGGSNNHQDSSRTTGSVSTGTNTYSNGQSGLANRYIAGQKIQAKKLVKSMIFVNIVRTFF